MTVGSPAANTRKRYDCVFLRLAQWVPVIDAHPTMDQLASTKEEITEDEQCTYSSFLLSLPLTKQADILRAEVMACGYSFLIKFGII